MRDSIRIFLINGLYAFLACYGFLFGVRWLQAQILASQPYSLTYYALRDNQSVLTETTYSLSTLLLILCFALLCATIGVLRLQAGALGIRYLLNRMMGRGNTRLSLFTIRRNRRP